MKKFISTMLISAILVGCGGGGGGGGSSSDTPKNNVGSGGGGETDPESPRNCTLTTLNGKDAIGTESVPRLVTVDGKFYGDVLRLNAKCTGGQISGLVWDVVEEPPLSEARLFRDDYVAGNVKENLLTFWDPSDEFVADGRYVVEVHAEYKDGGVSNTSRYEIDYIAALYLGGDYTADGDTYDDLLLDDTDRPYYVDNAIKAANIEITTGVTVYSNGCNGDEMTGYGCEIQALTSMIINGATMYNAVLRGSETDVKNDDPVTTLELTNSVIVGGSINHNSSSNASGFRFNNIDITHNQFYDMKGIVVTGKGGTIADNEFTNVWHSFEVGENDATISIKSTGSSLSVENNVFNDVGIHMIGINESDIDPRFGINSVTLTVSKDNTISPKSWWVHGITHGDITIVDNR